MERVRKRVGVREEGEERVESELGRWVGLEKRKKSGKSGEGELGKRKKEEKSGFEGRRR